ncbi:MAG: hypothetical protein NT120_03645 [Candidatus Aenigmarchaeota archaeon]|nr:hypothetical protein [Candidatus Aenigmarchaeota archaeon]
MKCRNGRENFEVVVPFGSDKNKCPLGLDVLCDECQFHINE